MSSYTICACGHPAKDHSVGGCEHIVTIDDEIGIKRICACRKTPSHLATIAELRLAELETKYDNTLGKLSEKELQALVSKLAELEAHKVSKKCRFIYEKESSEYGEEYDVVCSECGSSQQSEFEEFNFCPNCGLETER